MWISHAIWPKALRWSKKQLDRRTPLSYTDTRRKGAFLRMKIGVFLDHLRDASTQTGEPLNKIALRAAQAGIEFVHVNGNFWMENEARVDELLEQAGLYVGSSDNIFHFTQNRDLDKAEKLIRFLSRKGVEQLLLIPGFVHAAQSRQSAMDEAARCMKELMYLARSLHVKCSLEDYDNASAPFGTWQELKWYVDQIPELGISFDTGNFAFFGQHALEAYEQLKPHICHVHLKDRKYSGRSGEEPLRALDGKLLYPSSVGGGEMPVKEIVSDLKKNGYQGGVLIEHFGSADMMADMLASAEWLKAYA